MNVSIAGALFAHTEGDELEVGVEVTREQADQWVAVGHATRLEDAATGPRETAAARAPGPRARGRG